MPGVIWATGESLASLGALERRVMECLWAAPDGLSAAQLRDSLAARSAVPSREHRSELASEERTEGAGDAAERDLALTTVHTLLTRLAQKGFVAHDDGRPRRFWATASQADHVAAVMHDVLGEAADRDAVLARFVGSVSPAEATLLRRLLRRRNPATPIDAGIDKVRSGESPERG